MFPYGHPHHHPPPPPSPRHQVVEGGPLRTIITSLLLDHAACDRDTRREAENVLRAVGFSGGYSDLELCQVNESTWVTQRSHRCLLIVVC